MLERSSLLAAVHLIICSQATLAFQWTSSSTLRNNSTVLVCPGQDVTLAWSFTTDPQEHVVSSKWHFAAPGQAENVVATHVSDDFLLAPSYLNHVDYVPNGGIVLRNVSAADTGTYAVRVNYTVHGSTVTDVQTVQLAVSDGVLTTDGHLHASQISQTVYVNSSQQWHVQLACGNFRDVWSDMVTVTWTTPTNESLPSTSKDNGRFLLAVPNPVVTGEYTCKIDNSSPASVCVLSGSPVDRGATVMVDGIDAKFSVMQAQLLAQQQSQRNTEQELQAVKQQQEQSQQELQTLKQDNADLRSKLQTAAARVSFYVRLYNDPTLSSSSQLVFDNVITNQGGAYNYSTGTFTAPVNGTYVLYLSIVTSITSPRKRDVLAYITIDERYAAYAWSSYVDHTETGCAQAVVHLHVGQRVVVVNAYDESKYWTGDTTFSGALLHADLP